MQQERVWMEQNRVWMQQGMDLSVLSSSWVLLWTQNSTWGWTRQELGLRGCGGPQGGAGFEGQEMSAEPVPLTSLLFVDRIHTHWDLNISFRETSCRYRFGAPLCLVG